MILLDFPCFTGIWGVFGLWKPNSPFVLVDRQNGPVYTPKTLRFKGEMSRTRYVSKPILMRIILLFDKMKIQRKTLRTCSVAIDARART